MLEVRMADDADHAAAGEGAAKEANASLVINLPAVVTSNLDAKNLGAKQDQTEDTAADAASSAAAAAAPPRSRRFALLAASVAFAAAFGSFVGSVSGSGLARLLFPPPVPPAPAMGVENTLAAMHEIRLQLATISTLKANLENATRTATSQYAKIADRLDRIDQRSVAAVETTASLPAASLPAASVPPASPPAEPKLTDRVLQDWIVHDVRNGRALVESRYGGLFAVGEGSVLPGIGRVDMIKRQDGHWVVLTARGTITSAR
jgi:hypothetical protein